MNAIGFTIRRVARSFGLKNEMNRRMAITRELQLLAEAEELLGHVAWRDSENIQEAAEGYYQIRDLEAEAIGLRKEIRGLETENNTLLAEQEDLEGSLERQIAQLSDAKFEAMQRTIAWMNEIENLKIDSEITRKKYSGMKLRLKSHTDSGAGQEEIDAARNNLIQLKEEFALETKEIVNRQTLVEETDAEISSLEDQIAETRESARARITTLMNTVGKSSNLVARYGAKLGSIEKNITDLSFEMGNFLSNNVNNPTPEVREVIRKHRTLISKIVSLKSSIRFNRILAGQSV